MTVLARIAYKLDFNIYEIDLQEAGSYLTTITSQYANLIFRQQTKVDIHFEEGSIRATVIVAGIYAGIIGYGGLRTGIDYLINDAKSLHQLITSEMLKSGLDKRSILAGKRLHCDIDRVRRVLLAIEKLEQKNLPLTKQSEEISTIKTSIKNICWEISEADSKLLIKSISERYWPKKDDLPYWIELDTIAAREEDVTPLTNSFPPRLKAL